MQQLIQTPLNNPGAPVTDPLSNLLRVDDDEDEETHNEPPSYADVVCSPPPCPALRRPQRARQPPERFIMQR